MKFQDVIESRPQTLTCKTRDDLYPVDVVFRVFKTGGDVIALFPREIADDMGNCMSYQHIGQHGAATYNHVIDSTRPAKPAEYAALKRELERIGYQCRVIKRFAR